VSLPVSSKASSWFDVPSSARWKGTQSRPAALDVMLNELLCQGPRHGARSLRDPEAARTSCLLCVSSYVEKLAHDKGGQVLARRAGKPESPTPSGCAALRDARQVRGYSAGRTGWETGTLLRLIVSLENPTRTEDTRLLHVTHCAAALADAGERSRAVSRLQGAVVSRQG